VVRPLETARDRSRPLETARDGSRRQGGPRGAFCRIVRVWGPVCSQGTALFAAEGGAPSYQRKTASQSARRCGMFCLVRGRHALCSRESHPFGMGFARRRGARLAHDWTPWDGASEGSLRARKGHRDRNMLRTCERSFGTVSRSRCRDRFRRSSAGRRLGRSHCALVTGSRRAHAAVFERGR